MYNKLNDTEIDKLVNEEEIEKTIAENDLLVTSVLSGNRNFEGRIHPLVKANYLASPPLVVAYALAGTVNIDFAKEAIGKDKDGNDIHSGGNELKVNITNFDIANLIGSSRQTVTTLFNELAADGLLTYNRQEICFPDVKKLQNHCSTGNGQLAIDKNL